MEAGVVWQEWYISSEQVETRWVEKGFMTAARSNSEFTWDAKPCAAHLRYAAIFSGQGQGSSGAMLGGFLAVPQLVS